MNSLDRCPRLAGFRTPAGLFSAALLAIAASTPALHAASNVYANQILADNPVAYFQFDEAAGTTAAESAGHASGPFDGTYTGGVILGATSFHSNLGTAADLAGGYIDVPVIGYFTNSSVEVWLQLDSGGEGCCTSIASAGDWTTNALHWNLTGGNVFEHAVNSQGNVNTDGGSFVADGATWYHLVVTDEGGVTTTYVNGVEVSDNGNHTGAGIDYGNSNFQIGAWNGGRLLDGRMDEFAIYDTALSAERVLAHFQAATALAGPDTDGDGLPNVWEIANNLNPNDDGTTGESAPGRKDGPNGADGDPDGDRLINSREFQRGANPQDNDTDDDGLKDGEELDTYGTNPTKDDTDGDGLKDGNEVNTHRTNPARADTDGDALDDGREVTLGTMPTKADTDGDRFDDGLEVNTLQSNPLDPKDPPVVGGDSLYAQRVLADGPLAYYRFEERTGVVAVDSSTSGKHGIYTGDLGFGTPSFHTNLGSAADLTGGYIAIPNTGSFAESTAEVWLQLDAGGEACCTSIASAGDWTTNALHWNLTGGNVFEHAVNSQTILKTDADSFVADGTTWYHLVVTSGGGVTTTYVNGVEVPDNGDHTGPVIDYGNSNFQIGAWNGGRLLDGRIDEFAIYDKVLTPEQVLAHFQAATAGGPSRFPIRISRDAGAGTLTISWDSKERRLYNLRSAVDLSSADPADWPIFGGNQNMAATPPQNSVTFPLPADSARYFVVEEFPAP
ncbi:MAG: LamG-like jellyroll fold domain-containing protein [Verrucomicrobiales bacterium]